MCVSAVCGVRCVRALVRDGRTLIEMQFMRFAMKLQKNGRKKKLFTFTQCIQAMHSIWCVPL